MFQSDTPFPDRNGRNPSAERSPRNTWDKRAGMPRISLIAPFKLLLSVGSILRPPTTGVLNPAGGRMFCIKDNAGVTSVPPGWPRWSLCSYRRTFAPVRKTSSPLGIPPPAEENRETLGVAHSVDRPAAYSGRPAATGQTPYSGH